MSKKLLLADDSVTIQKVIQITFAHEDYELTVTDNGDEAFTKAQELSPDLVLADVYMPGKNGYELCAALKQDPTCRAVPVLLLAGSFEPFDEDKARAVKADGWLEKPFESQALIDKVAELLAAAPVAAEPEPGPEPEAEPVAPAPVDITDDFIFDEEPLEEVPTADFDIADDWSDVDAAVTAGPAEVVEDLAEPEPPVSNLSDDGDFAAGAAAAVAPESLDEPFVFEEETPEELPPIVQGEPAGLDDFDEEIMSLDDDDILGAEDLEPMEEEPTLAAWSREDFAVETAEEDFAPVEEAAAPSADDFVFVEDEPLEEEMAEPEPAEPMAVAEPGVDVTVTAGAPVDSGAWSVVEDAGPVVEEVAASSEAAPVDAGDDTVEQVEARASALSDADLEAIVEKVAGRVVEQLAGTILEKVAWEVVPDLAEALIKEEISKIKEAAA